MDNGNKIQKQIKEVDKLTQEAKGLIKKIQDPRPARVEELIKEANNLTKKTKE